MPNDAVTSHPDTGRDHDPGPDRLRAGVQPVLLPLVLWALYFGACYAWLAVACRPAPAARQVVGLAWPTAGLALASIATLGALGWLLLRALRATAQPDEAVGMVAALRVGAALIALVATLWTALPMLMLPACNS